MVSTLGAAYTLLNYTHQAHYTSTVTTIYMYYTKHIRLLKVFGGG